MLEVIIIWRLTSNIGKIAEKKGLKQIPYEIMAILLWVCGELLGSIFGYIFLDSESSIWIRYLVALFGAMIGAGMAFLVMHFIPKQEFSPQMKFWRSIWIPITITFLAVMCLFAGIGVPLIALNASEKQQIQASNPSIGIEIDSHGQVARPVDEISSKESIIYFSFYFDIPQGRQIPVTFDWYINGNIAYSYKKALEQGQNTVMLDRRELHMSQFNQGNYEVFARIDEVNLTSARFVVK